MEATTACLIQKHLWLCLNSTLSHRARNREELVLALMLFTQAHLSKPALASLHPSPWYLFSVLICKALVPAINPPKNNRKRELKALSFAECCIRRQRSQRCSRNYKEGGKTGSAWACVPLCHTISSCAQCHRDKRAREREPGGTGCQRKDGRSRQDSCSCCWAVGGETKHAFTHGQSLPLSEAGTCGSRRAQTNALDCKP